MMMMAVCGLAVATFASCEKFDDGRLKFSVSEAVVAPGATANVTISGGTQPFTAKSSDDKTATVKVDKNVMTITGVKEGATTIIVTDAKKVTGKLAVTVATPLSFDKANVNVAVGKEEVVTIKSGKTPYTATVKDKKIATATVKDAKITIKGVKAGTTTISVLDKNKAVGTITVTVK